MVTELATSPDPLGLIVEAFNTARAAQWLAFALALNQLLVLALKRWGKQFLKRWNVTLNALFSASAVALATMVGGVPWYEAVWLSLSGLGPDFIHQTLKNLKGPSEPEK